MDNLLEMNKFLEIYISQKLNQEKILIIRNEIESVIIIIINLNK